MENLTLFIIGVCIFLTYIFFLLRMVSKQHTIQKQTDEKVLNTEHQNNSKE